MMKLGTQTGSVVNHVLSRSVIGQPEPTVGMGATILCWTDRHAATITAIEGDLITVQMDRVKRVDTNGMSESQEWTFEPNPDGYLYYFRKATNGHWQQVRYNTTTRRYNKVNGESLQIGVRREYHDFSF